MNETCVEEVRLSIQSYGWSTLAVAFHSDRTEGDVSMKIFTATVGTPEMHVFDAIVVMGGGLTNVCNTDTLPSLNDAIAYHLGKLLLEGPYRIVAT